MVIFVSEIQYIDYLLYFRGTSFKGKGVLKISYISYIREISESGLSMNGLYDDICRMSMMNRIWIVHVRISYDNCRLYKNYVIWKIRQMF